MQIHTIVMKKNQWLTIDIKADSEEEALSIAKEDPDTFEEFGMEECDPKYEFEIQKKHSTGAFKP